MSTQRIYALLGRAEQGDDAETQGAVAVIDEVLQAYRSQDWARAQDALTLLGNYHLARLDLSVFAALYRRRIANFAVDPPPADWDGVFVATTK